MDSIDCTLEDKVNLLSKQLEGLERRVKKLKKIIVESELEGCSLNGDGYLGKDPYVEMVDKKGGWFQWLR